MRYQIDAYATGNTELLDYLDWLHLLHLAGWYGWDGLKSQSDLDYYLYEAEAVSEDKARSLANVLREADRGLRTEGGPSAVPQPIGTALVYPGLLKGPETGAFDYFAGEKGRLVSRVIALASSGELWITRLP